MKGFRGQVSTVGPDNCSADRIQTDACEIGGVFERFEDRPLEQRASVYASFGAIIEAEAPTRHKTWVSQRDYWKPAYSQALYYQPVWPAVTERRPRDPFVERRSTDLGHTWMWKSGERQSLFRADYVLVDINNAVFTTRESIVDYQILDTISSGASDHNAVFATLAV